MCSTIYCEPKIMPTLKLKSREVFLKAPPATCIWGSSFYIDANRLELIGEGQHLKRSDTVECTTEQRSTDNGRSWSEAKMTLNGERTVEGVSRKFIFPGYVCPHTNRLVRFYNEAVLPNDSPHPGEAGRLWRLYYTVSEDGGHSTTLIKSSNNLARSFRRNTHYRKCGMARTDFIAARSVVFRYRWIKVLF